MSLLDLHVLRLPGVGSHPGTTRLGHSLVVTLLAALAWAIGNALARRAGSASGLSLTVWSGVVVPIPALVLSMIVDSPAVVIDSLVTITPVAILSTLFTAVAASLIGYGIWNSLLARYPTSAVVPFTLLVPVIGIVTAWLVQKETPTATELLGGAVMLAGLAVAVIQRRSGKTREQASGAAAPDTFGTATPATAPPPG